MALEGGETLAADCRKTVYYILNIVLILVLGTGLSAWFLYYTDWFPRIGGLFGLGGMLAWAAFVTKLVSDDRKGAFADWLQKKLLESPYVAVVLVIMVFAALVAVSVRGTLVVDNGATGEAHLIHVGATNSGAGPKTTAERVVVAPRSQVKLSLPVNFLGSTRYSVKAEGLPVRETIVRAWERTEVYLPTSFLSQHVLLVRPTPSLVDYIGPSKVTLELSVDDAQSIELTGYGGETLWVGTGSDTKVPAARVAEWRLDLAETKAPTRLADRWALPVVWDNAAKLALGPNSRILAVVKDSDTGDVMGRGELQMPVMPPSDRFPLELVMARLNQE